MNLKVGMYIRTLDGISKVIEVRDSNVVGRFVNEDGNIYFMNEIMCAPSFNIIDLIEVGDYVNGYLVTMVSKDAYDEDIIFVGQRKIEESGYYRSYYNKDIKSIVTKEQMEQMSYKVGGKDE